MSVNTVARAVDRTVVKERLPSTRGMISHVGWSAFNAPRVALQEPGVRLDPLRAIANW
jgi:hypothetical protein